MHRCTSAYNAIGGNVIMRCHGTSANKKRKYIDRYIYTLTGANSTINSSILSNASAISLVNGTSTNNASALHGRPQSARSSSAPRERPVLMTGVRNSYAGDSRVMPGDFSRENKFMERGSRTSTTRPRAWVSDAVQRKQIEALEREKRKLALKLLDAERRIALQVCMCTCVCM
jgi:hypothetical protein